MIHEVYQPFTYLFLTSSFNCSVSSRSEFCEGKGEDVFSGLCAELGTLAPFNLTVPAEAEFVTEGERGSKGDTAILASSKEQQCDSR